MFVRRPSRCDEHRVHPRERELLRQLAPAPLPLPATARVFCLTQAAKYLPGNVGHHLGRIAYTRAQLHVAAVPATISVLQEGALAAAASLAVGTACALLVPETALPLPATWPDTRLLLVIALAGGFLALIALNLARPAFTAGGPAWRAALLRAVPTWRAVAMALPSFILIYLLNGIAVAIIASALLPLDADRMFMLAGAYAISWLIGFLLPGAPGGLGVRESAFVLLTGTMLPAEAALGIAALSRIANVLADVLIFLAGVALSTRATRH